MNEIAMSLAFVGGIMLAMLVALEGGRRLGEWRLARDGQSSIQGNGPMEGAIFALLGLLFAFTFSGAASRFDDRRHLVIDEANTIGTAYLRIEVLPPGEQPALRSLFRDYVDARLSVYKKLPDIDAARKEVARSVRLQSEIWKRAVPACRESGSPANCTLLLPALNDMFDIASTRVAATQIHPPATIYAMLLVTALGASLLAGFGIAGGRRRSWIHIICYSGIIAVTLYVIIDLEFPRFGLIRVDSMDQLLIDLRQSM